MQSSRDYERLVHACNQAGCILCRLSEESMHRYLEQWKEELFTDVDIRQQLRNSKGFCHKHTWQLVTMGANIQLAQAYRDVLSDMIEQLANDKNTRRRHWFETKAATTVPCPACQQQAEFEARLITTMREALADTTFYNQFAASSGLCLRHFQLAYTLRPLGTPENWLPPLRQAQLHCLQRLDTQLAELIRKHDYRFKDEAQGSEMLSWKTAAGLVAGENTQHS